MDGIEQEVGKNAGFLVWRLATEWRAAMDRVLEPFGLTQAQYSVLAPLYAMSRDGRRPSQRQVADVTGIDAVYISRLVRTLERGGFVARAASATDTRAVALTVTEQGSAVLQGAIQAVFELRDRLTAPLGGNDGAGTAELTATLRELLAVPEIADR